MKLRDHLTVGRWQGAPVRLHWTVLLAALVFGQARIAPGVWLAYVLLIFVHEAGHAWLVARFGLRLHDIVIHGLGGWCRWSGNASRWQQSVIAWGGILAQALAALVAGASYAIFGPPASRFFADMWWTFTITNLWIALFNLLPFGPLDGAKAWPLLPMAWKRRRRQAAHGERERLARSWLADVEPPAEHLREARDILDEISRRVVGQKDPS